MRAIKCVVVGDGNVGKTCMISRYVRGNLPEEGCKEYLLDNLKDIDLGGHAVKIWIWDTQGQEQEDRYRRLMYPQTDVFIVCYSLVQQQSLINITHWLPEVTFHCPATPIVLVGTKEDLLQNAELSAAKEKGKAAAEAMGAVVHVTCSAFSAAGLNQVFTEAARAALTYGPHKKEPVSAPSKKEKGTCQIF